MDGNATESRIVPAFFLQPQTPVRPSAPCPGSPQPRRLPAVASGPSEVRFLTTSAYFMGRSWNVCRDASDSSHLAWCLGKHMRPDDPRGANRGFGGFENRSSMAASNWSAEFLSLILFGAQPNRADNWARGWLAINHRTQRGRRAEDRNGRVLRDEEVGCRPKGLVAYWYGGLVACCCSASG